MTNTVCTNSMLSPSACYFSALGQETKETNNVSLIWLRFIINILLIGSATRMRQETIVSSCPLYGNGVTVSRMVLCKCALIYADGLAGWGEGELVRRISSGLLLILLQIRKSLLCCEWWIFLMGMCAFFPFNTPNYCNICNVLQAIRQLSPLLSCLSLCWIGNTDAERKGLIFLWHFLVM